MKRRSDFGKWAIALLALSSAMVACEKDEDPPEKEHEEEVITDVILTFTNQNDASVIKATAKDPDGEGAQELEVLDTIFLDTNAVYALSIEAQNNLETPGEDITEEIQEEGAEHQIFFSFTTDAFTNPAGNGNIDNASDAMGYDDQDANGRPIGLKTNWTTGSSAVSAGTYRVRLQHQPDVKTSTSGSNDGDTDFDLEFVLVIR